MRAINPSLMTRRWILSTRGSQKIPNTIGAPPCTFRQLWHNVPPFDGAPKTAEKSPDCHNFPLWVEGGSQIVAVGQFGAVGMRPYYQAAGRILLKKILVLRSQTQAPAASEAAHGCDGRRAGSPRPFQAAVMARGPHTLWHLSAVSQDRLWSRIDCSDLKVKRKRKIPHTGDTESLN